MKDKATTILLGLCLTALAVVASPAYARSTTAFSAFHVELLGKASKNAYLCLYENYGAVVNACSYPVSLEFDLPIDTVGHKTITVQNWWGGTDAEETFECDGTVNSGVGSIIDDQAFVNFTGGSQPLQMTLDVGVGGLSMQMICWNIPPGGGVANLNWTP
jgi:hypothetical protein